MKKTLSILFVLLVPFMVQAAMHISGDVKNAYCNGYLKQMNAGTNVVWQSDVTAGLISEWTFLEGSGTTATNSISGRPSLVLYNAPIWDTGIDGGYCLKFNGTNQSARYAIGFTNISALSNFSVSFYAKATVWNDGRSLVCNNGQGTISFATLYESGKITSGAYNGSSYYIKSTKAYTTTNQWIHVAITFATSSTNFIIYVNGVAGTTGGSPSTSLAQGVSVGSDPAGTRLFAGSIDEVRIYNRTLSSAEVLQLKKKWIP